MEPHEERVSRGNGAEGTADTVGELIRRIGDDVRVIARDEIELARLEVTHGMRRTAADASVAVLGGLVALVGWGMLCVAAVAALGAVIDPLWARLLLMAVVYVITGAAVAAAFAKRARRDLPRLRRAAGEARETAKVIREKIHHA